MDLYKEYIIETYLNRGEPSSKPVRARPLPDQGVSTSKKVECSEGMRISHPVGTLFKVLCKVTNREGTVFLYRHYKWDYEVISKEDADKFIRDNFNN